MTDPRFFRVYFRRHKQWFDVSIWDVHPNTFASWDAGRWEYWLGNPDRNCRVGLFGEAHFVASRVRADVVDHTLTHLWVDWMRAKDIYITPKNEEKLVLLHDELTRNFWREFRKA
jgi:hypothetical protein